MNMIDKAKLKNRNKIFKDSSAFNKKCEPQEDLNIIIKTPNISTKNLVFLKYQPAIDLCKQIEIDNSEYKKILSLLESLNKILANYLIKPKINLKTVELKIKNEKIKKEKEISELKKCLDDKIDSVLEKANMCLDNIKLLSKKNSTAGNTEKLNKNINTKTEGKIEKVEKFENISKTQNKISEIVKNLSDKYNDEFKVNEDNLNSYFTLIAKNRNSLKDLREKNKNLKLKTKNLRNYFNEIYQQSCNSTENSKNALTNSNKVFEFIPSSSFYRNLNSNFMSFSIINTLLFENLYVKVLYSSSENSLTDVFSLWFLLKKIKNLQTETNENFSTNFEKFSIPLISTHEILSSNFPKIFKKFCLEKLNFYLEILFKLSRNKNCASSSINEEEIFGKEFFQMFEHLSKIIKLKYLKKLNSDLKNVYEKYEKENNYKIALNDKSREELRYLKSAYSMIDNNCSFSFQICQKSTNLK